MLLNEIQPYSHRSPRLRALANGQILQGICEARVVSKGYYSADSFSALIALGPDGWADASFWAMQSPIDIEIQFSIDGGGNFTSLIAGRVDFVSLDLLRGLVHVEGRDLSVGLIESQTRETFANRTSSEIAIILAGRHGLQPCVTPTFTPVGRFYEGDHESLTLNRFSDVSSEWDLLTYLARREQFDLYVTGSQLYFQVAPNNQMPNAVFTPDNVIDLKLSRSLVLARDVSIAVKSWCSNGKTAVTQTAVGALGDSTDGTILPSLEYSLVYPNLTPDAASALAQQRLTEVVRHERSIEISLPGEVFLSPRSTIALSGTGTDFDQIYYVEAIERSLDPRAGFRETIAAANSSPRTNSYSSA